MFEHPKVGGKINKMCQEEVVTLFLICVDRYMWVSTVKNMAMRRYKDHVGDALTRLKRIKTQLPRSWSLMQVTPLLPALL